MFCIMINTLLGRLFERGIHAARAFPMRFVALVALVALVTLVTARA